MSDLEPPIPPKKKLFLLIIIGMYCIKMIKL